MNPVFRILTVVGVVTLSTSAWALDEFGPRPTWNAPTASEVRTQLVDWLDRQQRAPEQTEPILALWPEADEGSTPSERLDRLAESFALVDPEVRKLVDLCQKPRLVPLLPDFPWLDDQTTPPLVRHNLRLYYGRWLTQERLYDEALVMLDGLEPENVVDPASLLFYQTVTNQRLLNVEACQQAALRLLEREAELPTRYQHLARLIRDDIDGLKDDSLDHISRRMDDIRRRLDLGRAGQKVREVEDGVIASLDKLIKELEDQQQQQQSASSAGGQPSGQPAQESRIAEQKGPGKVDRKDIGNTSGWGDLPPKQREEALQQIGQEFPSHYRDAIEQYFRKIASEETPENE